MISLDKPKAGCVNQTKTFNWRWAIPVALCVIGIASCDDVVVSGGDTTSSSSTSSGSGGAMALPAEGGVGDSCGPADGPALDFTIGVPVACDMVPSGPQFRFYAYPGGTGSLAAGQSWSFDSASMGQMGNGSFYPMGIGGNADNAQSGSIQVITVGMGTVDVHYEFVTSTGSMYSGEATLTVCPSMPLCG